MPYDGKGKMLAVAVRAVPAPGKKSEGRAEAEGKAKGLPEGLESAMSKLSTALKEGDAAAAAKAFATAHGICSDYEG